jgi:toxin HigB-1
MVDTVRRSRGLKELFETGKSRRVAPDLHRRARIRLDANGAAASLEALNQPGFDLHPLHGKPQRYSIHVNWPWCITFEWRTARRSGSIWSNITSASRSKRCASWKDATYG